MAEDLAVMLRNSLRTVLSETLFRAAKDEAYILNRGEPGFVETMKSLSAAKASTPPRSGRKPVVSHANHVLFGLDLVARAVDGDRHAFDNADWDEAWKLERVNDAEWSALVAKLEATAQHVLEAAPEMKQWTHIMLTGTVAIGAHTAYHVGAVRQILHDVEAAK